MCFCFVLKQENAGDVRKTSVNFAASEDPDTDDNPSKHRNIKGKQSETRASLIHTEKKMDSVLLFGHEECGFDLQNML